MNCKKGSCVLSEAKIGFYLGVYTWTDEIFHIPQLNHAILGKVNKNKDSSFK